MFRTGLAVNSTQLPPAFIGHPILYVLALASVMSIAALGIGVAGWMIRDAYRDRNEVKWGSLLFNFRLMIFCVGSAAMFRALPEVLYLQVFGDPDVADSTKEIITQIKRVADVTALWFVGGWVLLLILIYPPICRTLTQGIRGNPNGEYSKPTLKKVLRPIFCFLCIVLVSIGFAYSKIYTG